MKAKQIKLTACSKTRQLEMLTIDHKQCIKLIAISLIFSTNNYAVIAQNRDSTINDLKISRSDSGEILSNPKNFVFSSFTALTQRPVTPNETNTKISLEFVGKGDIQNSVSQGSEIQANTGIGVIMHRYNGVRLPLQDFEIETSINVASTSDTIYTKNTNNTVTNRRDFGSFVRNPLSSKQSLYLNSIFYFGYPLDTACIDTNSYRWRDLNCVGKFAKIFSGASARLIASNTIWSHEGESLNASVFYFRAGLFHEFLPDNYRIKGNEKKSEYSILFGANYSYSGIRGDIANNANKELMNKILNTNRTGYSGIELNMALKLRNIRFEFQMPIVTNNQSEVEGLTNTQFIFTARFVGGFPMKID